MLYEALSKSAGSCAVGAGTADVAVGEANK